MPDLADVPKLVVAFLCGRTGGTTEKVEIPIGNLADEINNSLVDKYDRDELIIELFGNSGSGYKQEEQNFWWLENPKDCRTAVRHAAVVAGKPIPRTIKPAMRAALGKGPLSIAELASKIMNSESLSADLLEDLGNKIGATIDGEEFAIVLIGLHAKVKHNPKTS